MENNEKPSKSYLQFGLIYGVLMILGFVIVYVLQIDVIKDRVIGTSISILNYFVFPVAFIVLGCNNFKNFNKGLISFVECLKVGVSIVFVGALIFAVFNLIFNLLFPEYLEEILKQTEQIMLEQNPNMTREQVEMAISMTRKFSSPVFSIPIMILIFSVIGFIYSLIIGLIVKKDQPQSF